MVLKLYRILEKSAKPGKVPANRLKATIILLYFSISYGESGLGGFYDILFQDQKNKTFYFGLNPIIDLKNP